MRKSSQMHGKAFENMIKSANGIFTHAAADRERSPNQMFDIDAGDDLMRGIPTSIKSTGTTTIALSDARKFWESFTLSPFRMVVGKYKQEEGIKQFYEVHEFVVLPEHSQAFLGDVSLEQIKDFHNAFSLEKFPLGKHSDARALAQAIKSGLKDKLGIVSLNPKIDSKKQRRLQCSVRLADAIAVMEGNHTIYEDNFGMVKLPVGIVSSARQ